MFSIVFYKDRRGREPVKEYLEKLNASAEHNKEHRAKLKKIYEYLGVVKRHQELTPLRHEELTHLSIV